MVRRLSAPYGIGDVAELLTDELVTNAVVHGGGRFHLSAVIDEHSLRVRVKDEQVSGSLPVAAAGHDRDRGRGLTIVEALASHWGIECQETGKWVWFEIDLPVRATNGLRRPPRRRGGGARGWR
jgi:anti-sigma regulatory factor (Ser/Thr protein kinase)